MEDKKLIDIKELSRLISTPKGTIYNLVYLRRIPFIKRGRSLRFDAEEVIRSLPHYGTMDQAGQRWKGRQHGPLPTWPNLVCGLLRQR